MANFNKVIMVGNLTRDPELRYTPNGSAVCEFGIAANRTYTTSDGQQQEDTCFVDVSVWGRRGEVVSEYFSKGRPILIEGRLNYDTWETPDGRRSKHTIVAYNFEFIGGRQNGSGGGGGGRAGRGGSAGGGGRPQTQQGGQSRQSQGSQGTQQPQQPPGGGGEDSGDQEGFDVSDDEIPF
jgi:single-strand DNA-binding protein